MHIDRIDPALGHWLAGFVDGEGCFLIHKIPDRRGYGCRFAVSLRADDEAALRLIRDTLCVGQVYSMRLRAAARPQSQFNINTRDGCAAVVEFFDRFPLRAKKAEDYAIWRLAVHEWCSVNTGTKRRDWSVMARLHDELKAVRHYT